MKELDELRSSTSSGSTIVTAGGVAGSGGGVYHKNSTQSTKSYKANNGAVGSGQKAPDSHSVTDQPLYQNNLDAGGGVSASKNDSHSVARAIIQAVKSRSRKDKALSVPNAYTVNKKNPFFTTNSVQQPVVVNGHATEEEISQISNQKPGLAKSPIFSKSNRLTKRFQLDLKTPIFSSSRLHKKAGLNRASSLETATHSQQRKQSTPSVQGKGPVQASSSVGATPAKKENKEENEHGLIAYKSALLQVSPSPSPQSSAVESPPSPTQNSGQPTQVQVNLKAKKALPTTSAENSPKPGPSRANTDSRPHSVGAMHEGPPRTSDSIEGDDSISIDDLTVVQGATIPRDQTITTGHFSAITEAGTPMPSCCASCSPSTESFLRFRNQYCTSYRLRVASLRNPVDVCLLPNDCLAIADYDNGFLVLSPGGDVVKHCLPVADGKNACGIACSTADSEFRLLVLAYKEGAWSINVYDWTFELTETIPCPQDPQIETWALRKIVLAPPIGGCYMEDNVEISNESIMTRAPSCALYLMASGETKSTVWSFDFTFREWKMIVSENSRRGAYNDFSIKFDPKLKETHFLLCDWKKAQLGTVVVNDRLELVDNQTIRIRRVKGQEWIVQGPKLAVWDEHSNILVYDGSGKLFLFDGDSYKCKKIVGDLGKGEISALVVRDGWCYALCRYRLCIEAFLYNEMAETSI